MYTPKFNQEKDISVLHALIKGNPFGAWVTMSKGEITVNHIPFVLHEHRGEFGTLVGHVARANMIWQDYSTDVDSVIVFQGENAYISPSWYPSKHEHGKAVPTWNYAVVHAHGVPKIVEDAQWLLEHVNELTDIHERQQSAPWKVADAPGEFIQRLLGAIVGVEIPIRKLSGKWKLGQNRSESDQRGVLIGLRSVDSPQSHGLAQLLREYMPPDRQGE